MRRLGSLICSMNSRVELLQSEDRSRGELG